MKKNNLTSSRLTGTLLQVFLLVSTISFSQSKKDTVLVTPEQVNTKTLKPSTNRYLVYFKMGKDSSRSRVQFWTRNIAYGDYQGKEVIIITQEWEDKDSVMHKVRSVCDKKTFAPLYQYSWWKPKSTSEFDFINKKGSVNELPLSDADTAQRRKNSWTAFKIATGQYCLNWHLDMEAFSILDYKNGRTFLIPFYEPGWSQPAINQAYTVIGSDTLIGYNDQKIDCWLLEHGSSGNREIFWINKKTKEVLKLEQELGEDKWRYKIKFGFSI